MARAPLAKGDDGSGNRYPVRATNDYERSPIGRKVAESMSRPIPPVETDRPICGKSYAGFGGCVKSPEHKGYCEDVHRYLFVGKSDRTVCPVCGLEHRSVCPSDPATLPESFQAPKCEACGARGWEVDHVDGDPENIKLCEACYRAAYDVG